jgi:hypothetical protein
MSSDGAIPLGEKAKEMNSHQMMRRYSMWLDSFASLNLLQEE